MTHLDLSQRMHILTQHRILELSEELHSLKEKIEPTSSTSSSIKVISSVQTLKS